MNAMPPKEETKSQGRIHCHDGVCWRESKSLLLLPSLLTPHRCNTPYTQKISEICNCKCTLPVGFCKFGVIFKNSKNFACQSALVIPSGCFKYSILC